MMFKCLRPVSVLIALIVTTQAVAQEKPAITRRDFKPIKATVGIGAGLDHGGIGVRFEYMPVPWLGFFAGGGTTLIGMGYNVGLAGRLTPLREATLVAVAMYGYNAALAVKGPYGNVVSRTTYFGPSFGLGGEFRVGRARMNKVSLKVLVPIRSQEFHDDAEATGADFFPVAISVGYNFSLW
jgi:hypothetical protein